jgi:mono/diheme cytochrome c family protein
MKTSLSLSVVLAAAMVAPAQAQVADAQEGRALAQQVCADCHAVLPDEARSPKAGAPTFPQVAAAPGMTATALTVALTTPHAGMPMFRLTAEQRADVIAYILSLR